MCSKTHGACVAGQQQRSLVHKVKETVQQWEPRDAEPSEDGEAFWLPGDSSVLYIHMYIQPANLRMLDAPQAATTPVKH